MARTFITTVSDSELTKCLKQISLYDGKARLGVESAIKEGTKRVRKAARRRVAVRSGTLKRSLVYSFSTRTMEGMVRAKQPYAHLVEFGAQPVIAKPKKRKAMKMSVKGKTQYTNIARIPERKAKPFLVPSFEEEMPVIIADVKKVLNNA